jgi:hypothetical protein
VSNGAPDSLQKPATAARMYDYYLGGIHNFPADREAAKVVIERSPLMREIVKANRAFLARAVRYLTSVGVRQFLDIGSGLPTEGNVHEIAQASIPDARVVYVDIDPEAVSESLELLKDNQYATAIQANARQPEDILGHPKVRKVLDFDQPMAIMLVAVLHFVEDTAEACDIVTSFRSAVVPGSHLVVAHATVDEQVVDRPLLAKTQEVYRQRTTTPLTLRTKSDVARFFDGFELLEPGLTWPTLWRPDPDTSNAFGDHPEHSSFHVGIGRLP